MEKDVEGFIEGFRQLKVENFESEIPSVNDMEGENETPKMEQASEESYAVPLNGNNNKKKEGNNENNENNENVSNNSGESNNSGKSNNSKSGEVCQSKDSSDKTGDCMFGCPQEKVVPKKTDFNEMMMTIEETEKICDLIEEKDRARKEKEDQESLKKQLELNRKFLIQQKAQDKQIKDLEGLVKSMTFTHEMNEAAVAKCGKHNDDCLSDKEKQLKELLLQKQAQTKKVKININFKDFGKEFLSHLMNKIGLNSEEMSKLLAGLNNGSLDMEQLKAQLGFGRSLSNESPFLNDSDCPKCDVDLSEYIDRCKIPCHKCRDPSWNCPQDIKS
jgi:hypothetical protein